MALSAGNVLLSSGGWGEMREVEEVVRGKIKAEEGRRAGGEGGVRGEGETGGGGERGEIEERRREGGGC